MPRQKDICPSCGGTKTAVADLCRRCKPTYLRTDEHRAKARASTAGKPKPWLRGRARGEVAAKIAAAWTPEMRDAARLRGLAFAENREWLVSIATALSGPRNPNYQGAGQESPYAPGWGREYRRKVRARADGICEWCATRPVYGLDLHHRDFTKTNHTPDNLAVICRSCHKTAHGAHKRLLRE